MLKYFFYAALCLISATTSQCSKTAVLPDETQTGAGTFACKVNGTVWQYKDATKNLLGSKPSTNWYFDANEKSGAFDINAYRYDDNNNFIDHINFYGDSLSYRNIVITNAQMNSFKFAYDNTVNGLTNCDVYSTQVLIDSSKNFYRQGKLTISRLDRTARIIAGTFECTIYRTGCDSLKITDGRFDLKY